ncbi:hypothetical protein QBC38DRAFT_487854 [Podospora fimiseda]|uniref:Uncharacterized protein n=1 Tax=Podospora fimiseda TaxID=252190 RepID=A0AAN7BHI0_9PEZI|nr:hypothetical protein QBC38DRAFT_487854 [Podospora fimiseda]
MTTTTNNKTIVLITGANSGIGLETVIALSKSSPNYHILLGARSIEKGQAALTQIQEEYTSTLQSTISVVQIDVTSQDSITALVEHISSNYGKLDVLLSNAGIIVYQECDTLTNLRLSFETNTFGPTVLVEALEPLLRKSGDGKIIHVSSEQGSTTLRLSPDYRWVDTKGDYYRASKAALNMLAACQRHNYSKDGSNIKVCSFNPGFCVSNLTGEKGKEMRINMGARPASDPANAMVAILEGKEKEAWTGNGMVTLDGGILPW